MKKPIYFLMLLPFLSACGQVDVSPIATANAAHITTLANKNAVSVTVPLGPSNPTELVSLDLGFVTAGDLFLVDSFALLTKGAIAGDTLVLVRSSGTGQVFFAMDTIDLEDRRYHPANTNTQIWLHGVARVVTSGTVTLHMRSASAGSDATTGPSQSQIRAYRLD